jgi:ribonuclease P protein component
LGPQSFYLALSGTDRLESELDAFDLSGAVPKVATYQCLCRVLGKLRFALVRSDDASVVYDEVVLDSQSAYSDSTLVTLRGQVAAVSEQAETSRDSPGPRYPLPTSRAGRDHEAHFPAQQPKAEQDPRLPHPHADDRRAERAQAQTPARPTAIGRLKGPAKGRFDEVFTRGDQASSGCLRLHWLPGTGKVGVATSRSIGTHARRNRQKRRVRAALAAIGGDLSSHDMVFLVKVRATEVPWDTLLKEAEGLLAEASRRSRPASESP